MKGSFNQFWSHKGRQRHLKAKPVSTPRLFGDRQAGLVDARGQQLQGELCDDSCDAPDTVRSMQEDRQCVAEVATLAEVSISMVLCLQ